MTPSVALLAGMIAATPTPPAEPGSTDVPEHAVSAPRNFIMVAAVANVPNFATSIGYDRKLHRLVSVGARFEIGIPNRGYGHLQGMSEAITATVWAPRFLRGFFAEGSLGMAHSLLVAQPKFDVATVVAGVSAGGRWRFGRTFFVGASAGLRNAWVVHRDRVICTQVAACPSTRTGLRVRVALELGFAF